LARIHGLYGQTESDRTHCDIVEEAIRDAQHELWWFVNSRLQEKDRRKFAEEGSRLLWIDYSNSYNATAAMRESGLAIR